MTFLHIFSSLTEPVEHGTHQRNSQCEEPGIDEKEVSANLDDVEEQRGDRQQDTLGHNKLLYSIFKEEPQCLRSTGHSYMK